MLESYQGKIMKYFVYFSNSGNGDLIAEILKQYGYKAIKVEPVKPFGKMHFFKIMKYGFQAMRNKKANIKEVNLVIKEDDEVVIGYPIWNDRLSTPINTLLADYNFDKKTTRYILYPAGNSTSKSLESIKKMGFEKEPVVVPNPKKYVDAANKLLEQFK